jgi:hypothetical protein
MANAKCVIPGFKHVPKVDHTPKMMKMPSKRTAVPKDLDDVKRKIKQP